MKEIEIGRRRLAARPASLAIAAAIVCLGIALSACKSNVGTKAAYAPDQPAGELYNKGLAYLNAGKLSDAIKQFDEVDRQHPYSEDARKALIMSAFASYRRGECDDTIMTANRYLTLYPGTPDAAYAQYLIGQSYFKQIPDVTRDQKATQKALAAMEEIVQRYPDSEYVDDAERKIVMTQDQLAGKEMQIGRYYLERREYIAAINRFKHGRHPVPGHAPRRGGAGAPGRGQSRDGPRQRGADRGGRARAQFPRQPLVQGRVQSSEEEGRPARRQWRRGERRVPEEDDLRRRPAAKTCSSPSRSATSSSSIGSPSISLPG